MQFLEMDEGGMSEYYSDAIDKAMPIDNRRNTKKRRSYSRNELWYSIVARCADGLMLITQVKGPE